MTDHASRPAGDPRAWAPPSVAEAGSAGAGAEAVVVDPAPAPSRRRIDPLAVAALVTGLLGLGLAAVVLGHVALVRTGRTRERGRGLAIAGLVLGYIGIVVSVVLVLSYRALIDSLRTGGYLPA